MILNQRMQVTSNIKVAEETYALRFRSRELAEAVLPGQFVNVGVSVLYDPLLRRPYSISNVHEDECEILYAVVGKGTTILSKKRPGEFIEILGPLGNTFGYEKHFSTAIIVAGGIGVAPFPFLTRTLIQREIPVVTFLGVRSAARLFTQGLSNIHIATDDGSHGYHGTVIACLTEHLDTHYHDTPMIFACGPNAMLNAAQRFAQQRSIPCELSLESEMACGIGICQGCPIERTAGDRKYALVCTDGPCFDANDVRMHTTIPV